MTPVPAWRRFAAGVRDVDARTRGGAPSRTALATTLGWLVAMTVIASVRTGHAELPDTALWVGILGSWAPLLLRTSRPLRALAGTVLAEALVLIFLSVPDAVAEASSGMGAYQPVPLATCLAVATLAARVPRRAGWLAGLVAGGSLALVGFTVQSAETYLTDLVLFYLVVTAAAVGVWWAGRRERAAREEAERRQHTEQAVLDERLRIARELHDVLAHNLTLVNAQAGVARYLMRTDADAADRALGDITRHTGRAIDELRATIGLLRTRDDEDARGDADARRPVPGLDRLPELLDAFRSTGTSAALTVTGNAVPLAQHVDLAAYRIVQESVTNAAKHAPGVVVDVALTWTDAGVRLRVSNPAPRAPAAAPAPGTGNGLIGMRERATAAGGTLRAGPAATGGFEVVATLPADPPAEPGAQPPPPPHTTPETPR